MDESAYAKTLTGETRCRYRQKIIDCVGYDPYSLQKHDLSQNVDSLPGVESIDIINYLVLQTSFYTSSQMKAYKSLDAYNYFVCGWVNDLGSKEALNDCRLVFARVSHSQRSTEKPLQTWIVAKQNGEVLTAHCDCMAGLSESCSHVGAVLFAIEAGVKIRESASCTMEKCKWLPPTIRKIPPAPVAMIDFSSARSKKQKIDQAIAGNTDESRTAEISTAHCPGVKPGSATYWQFLMELHKNSPRSALLMSRAPYYKYFVPKSVSLLPKTVMAYRSPETIKLSAAELLAVCREFSFEELTLEQVQAVEEETRDQSSSNIWFTQRAGRVTASKIKQVLQTSLSHPSKALIKSICYPETQKFSTAAIRYGCKFEPVARKQYEQFQQRAHEGFSCMDSGLWLNPQWPYMGASPDGVVSCSCHGTGVCEIKCPESKRDEASLLLCAGEPGFCLIKDGDDVKLDRNHAYYYQVQAQLHIVGTEYCDFVVWNKNDIFVERILPDYELWNNVIPKVHDYFTHCILPEVLGQQFTKVNE